MVQNIAWLPSVKDAPQVTRHIKRALVRLGLDPNLTPQEIVKACSIMPTGKYRVILGTSQKVEKGVKLGVLTSVVYLSPFNECGILTCSNASLGCRLSCLGHSSGRLKGSQAKRARMMKTLWLHFGRDLFRERLAIEINRHINKAKKKGLIPAVRLNGSSDILWENFIDMEAFDCRFYDYTKHPISMRDNLPSNYHITFSLDERSRSMKRALDWLAHGYNVAVVVAETDSIKLSDAVAIQEQLCATTWHGYKCLNGDDSDVRFFDGQSQWVVLHAKGPKALRDTSGFVHRFERR